MRASETIRLFKLMGIGLDWEGLSYYVEAFISLTLAMGIIYWCPTHFYWSGLPIGHAIMSIGRCYLKPMSHYQDGTPDSDKQLLARYFNEYGSWLGMFNIVLGIVLDQMGGTDLITGANQMAALIFLNAILPHVVLIPALIISSSNSYARFRKTRSWIMLPLCLLMMLSGLSLNAEGQLSWMIWFISSLQLTIVLFAYGARMNSNRSKRKGKSQSVYAWRYGTFAFIALHCGAVLLVNL